MGAKRKGFDIAGIDDRRVLALQAHLACRQAVYIVMANWPAVVAIDSPRSCAAGGQAARDGEFQLARSICGIRWTPDAGRVQASAYYAWTPEGCALFDALAARGVEVFPTASWTRWQGKRGPRTRATWTRLGLGTLGLIGSGVSSAITGTLVAVLVVIACTIGFAVLGGIAWLVYRVRQDHPGRPLAARPVYTAIPRAAAVPGGPERPALKPPRNELHLQFHGMNPAVVAEAVRHSAKER